MESTKQIRSIRPIRAQKKQSLLPSLQGGAGGRLSQGADWGRLFRHAVPLVSLRCGARGGCFFAEAYRRWRM